MKYIDKLDFKYSHKTDLYSWTKGKEHKLSDNFTTYEFECKCARNDCREQIIRKGLIEKLQQIRTQIKEPIRINSGYRCKGYQEKLRKKGLPTAKKISQHRLGGAADIAPVRNEGNAEFRFARITTFAEFQFSAIGYGHGWLHVDMRDDKKRTWTY